jgi:molecular chaperone GrpE
MQNERRRADEMTTAAKRLQAEFDNYKKRTAAASATAREEGRKEVIEKLLPAVDALFQAEKLIKDESVLQGLRLISEKIDALLSSFCVTKIQSKGEEFDPEYHNAVMTVDQPNMSGKITEVLLDGYMISGKLLRHATVIIAK